MVCSLSRTRVSLTPHRGFTAWVPVTVLGTRPQAPRQQLCASGIHKLFSRKSADEQPRLSH